MSFREELAEGVGPFTFVFIEAVLTFFLVTAVLGSAVAGRNGNVAVLGIGLVLVTDFLMGGVLTGASMNRARRLGPTLVMGNSSLLCIFVGPLLGVGLAALFFDGVNLRRG